MPRSVQNVAILCLIVSGLCGVMAGGETMQLFQLQTMKNEPPQWGLDPEVDASIAKATEKGVQALEGMRDVRLLTLVLLSIACALAFVGSTRILRPFGLPREGVRKLLVGSALAAALLRTLDGAQLLVVARKESAFLGTALAALKQYQPYPSLASWVSAFLPLAAAAQTALVAGAFVLVSQYFRSEKVRKIVAFKDAHPE
jgi:hypothetical protein